MKVEFTNIFKSEEHFKEVCNILGIKYRRDPYYRPHFFGCDAPDTGYIIEYEGNIEELQKTAKEKGLYIESLIDY